MLRKVRDAPAGARRSADALLRRSAAPGRPRTSPSSRLARPITMASGLFSSCATPASRLPMALELRSGAGRRALTRSARPRRAGGQIGERGGEVRLALQVGARSPPPAGNSRPSACIAIISVRRPSVGAPPSRSSGCGSPPVPARWRGGTMVSITERPMAPRRGGARTSPRRRVELDDAALRIGRDDGRQRVVDDRRLERLGTLLGGLRLARRIEGVARQQRPGRPAGRQHRLARRRVERLGGAGSRPGCSEGRA